MAAAIPAIAGSLSFGFVKAHREYWVAGLCHVAITSDLAPSVIPFSNESVRLKSPPSESIIVLGSIFPVCSCVLLSRPEQVEHSQKISSLE
jgi:hypothetical protein